MYTWASVTENLTGVIREFEYEAATSIIRLATDGTSDTILCARTTEWIASTYCQKDPEIGEELSKVRSSSHDRLRDAKQLVIHSLKWRISGKL